MTEDKVVEKLNEVKPADPLTGEVQNLGTAQPDPAPKKNSISIKDTSETSLMNPEVYVQMKILANDFINSKAIPGCWQTASQVLVGLQTGLEMGMKPMEAMNSLYVVNGAVNVWGKAAVRRLKEHGYEVTYTNESESEVTATATKDEKTYSATFKFSNAEKSGYTTDKHGLKFGWKPGQNRKLKLRYGAVSEILKTYLPEVLGSAVGIADIENDLSPVRVASTVTESDQQDIKEIASEYAKHEETDSQGEPSGAGQPPVAN